MDENEDFLSRWSRRKRESGAAPAEEAGVPISMGAFQTTKSPAVAATPAMPVAEKPLPPVESLTPESDFHPFMKPDVDEGLKRRALKTLFQDPHYNEMDMLDIYVDDYSKPDPLPEGWLAKLRQMDRLGHYQEPVKPDPEASGQKPGIEEKGLVEQGVEAGDSTAFPATESEVGEAPELGESCPGGPTPP